MKQILKDIVRLSVKPKMPGCREKTLEHGSVGYVGIPSWV